MIWKWFILLRFDCVHFELRFHFILDPKAIICILFFLAHQYYHPSFNIGLLLFNCLVCIFFPFVVLNFCKLTTKMKQIIEIFISLIKILINFAKRYSVLISCIFCFSKTFTFQSLKKIVKHMKKAIKRSKKQMLLNF